MITAARVIAVACIFFIAAAPMTAAQEESSPSHTSFGASYTPVLERWVGPVYPEECRKAGAEGTVILEVWINKKGIPEAIKVLRGLEDVCEGMNAAAVQAVEQWRLKPPSNPPPSHPRTGMPGLVCMTLTVKFSLDDTPSEADGFRKVKYHTGSYLRITADLYAPHQDPTTPLIILFHQAGWSRGEYREIAPRLNSLGYNCLAVDLRSGGEVNGVVNETWKCVEAAGKGTSYVDALLDLGTVLARMRSDYPKARVLAWGSSYSASLVLRIAGEIPDLVDAVLAFSPGEYFAQEGKPENWIAGAAAKITVPVFITSAKEEKPNWAPIFAAIPEGKKTSYVPDTDGNHGSRALWKEFEDSEGYWEAVTAFLAQFTQKQAE